MRFITNLCCRLILWFWPRPYKVVSTLGARDCPPDLYDYYHALMYAAMVKERMLQLTGSDKLELRFRTAKEAEDCRSRIAYSAPSVDSWAVVKES